MLGDLIILDDEFNDISSIDSNLGGIKGVIYEEEENIVIVHGFNQIKLFVINNRSKFEPLKSISGLPPINTVFYSPFFNLITITCDVFLILIDYESF